jgi:hypothetical protein
MKFDKFTFTIGPAAQIQHPTADAKPRLQIRVIFHFPKCLSKKAAIS